ncbi:MAG: hypothetical protein GWM88_00655 [Pseudomonadales bacterium]|nr:hypothetical protein [Pseudomonadales bacterium]NIX06601.1 hypothetical protein [Pseudomonadales bacterium]
MIVQGLQLMLAGMGMVFLFLSVLVAATLVMSNLVMRLQGEPGPTSDEVAAILAAIEQHRASGRDGR